MIEDDVIERLRRGLGASRPSPEGVGDDAAVLRPDDGRVIALDTLNEGVHFDLRWSSPADAAYKALAVNASDLWAMGAEPRAWLLALGLGPAQATDAFMDELVAGFAAAIADLDLDVALVGGDTVLSPGGLSLSVTMVGACDGAPLTRASARPGDGLFVDGPIGLAGAGLELLRAGVSAPAYAHLLRAHRRPRPRRLLAPAARAAGIRAAIDVSDGLVRDATRLARASGVGIDILPDLPGAADLAAAAAAVRTRPSTFQLHGGDDYVRLVAAPESPGPDWFAVGRVVAPELGVAVVGRDGRRTPVTPAGFEHFGPAGA